ncbi:tetratricopeptide repeat-containing sensor histidine kinase [Flavobacterium gelatinilyticum]|uniref:tetratricopeptide repeat-containing sensor histidine kinase n=1 Tax=Flavobacterium gelatinilyticum TaxID=3003260 RepID=UPI00247FAEDE|nr:ATP-binding protein [Flavobacterium gelatinilyticum]
MVRSPFFILLIFLFFLSCEEKATVQIKPGLNKKTAVMLQKKAIDHFKKSNYNSAFYYFNKSKIRFESIKDSSNVVYNLIQMAYIQQINGDYYGSKETLTEALPYGKNDNNYKAAINNFFGIADKELAVYDDAIFYYNEAIKDSNDSISKQSPLNNIAVVYIKQKKYNEAIEILEAILNKKIFDDKEHWKSKSRVIDNLGYAYFKKDLNEKGIQLMTESLALRKQINDSYGSIESYLHLAEYYSHTNRKKSNESALIAYRIATETNSVDERLKALSFLISNDAGTKYGQQYITLNDSIIKIRNNFKNKFAKIKYDSKKEKDENQKLRLEKIENELSLQEAKYQRIFLGIGITSLVILIIILVIYFRNKNRITEIKTSYKTETRIAKDIHDGLANDVFHAITFTQTQPLVTQKDKESLLKKLDDIYIRVRGISRENNDIDTGPNFPKILKDMLSTYNNNTTNVIINGIEKVNWEVMDDLKKVAVQRVLHELMVNMKKHSEASVVALKFESNSNTLFINYSDNGKGCEKEKIIKNGMQNMENRILSNKGTITFDTEPNNGFKVKITMPK